MECSEPIRVKPTQSSMLRPAEHSPQQFLFLSCFDLRLWHYTYIRRILFFPARGGVSADRQAADAGFAETVENLRLSLAKALVHFYPLAGRLTEIDDSENGVRPSVDCNDAGVEFVSAEADSSLAELQPEFQPENNRFRNLVAEPDKAGDHTAFHKLPLLCVQVTRFKCGGVALGLAFNHVVSDGPSFWKFVRCWAEISATGSPLSPLPLHDRFLLNPATSPELKKLCDLQQLDLACAKDFRFVTTTEVKNGACMVNKKRLKLIPPSKEIFFCFSARSLKQLKDDALAGLPEEEKRQQWFSSFEVLSALFWRCINRARKVGLEEQVSFYAGVGCRDRLPFLPQSYFGNAAHTMIVRTSALDLLTGPLAFAAGLIHQLTRQCSKEVIAGFIGTSELHSVFSHAIVDPHVCAATGSSKLVCLECDFGWRKPACVRQVTDNLPGIMVFNPGQLGPGGIDVSLRLFPSQMEALTNDAELLLYWKNLEAETK